ncbi:MAG: hypothetical protein OXC60_03430 [Litoreibacter sp.]|nr:hypothetical protein [Litoreibacter sp.]
MTIEIGSLVVKGSFGAPAAAPERPGLSEEELLLLRREILEEVRDMLADADRRARER